MRPQNSATHPGPIAAPTASLPEEHPAGRRAAGLPSAAAGVVAFSLTFPATAWALEGFGPWTVTCARLCLGALIAAGCLAAARSRPPARRHWPGLAVVAGGTVVGYPLLTALALTTASTGHAAVVAGLLPLVTALYATARGRSRPSPAFWAAAGAGAAIVAWFTLAQGGGALATGDLLLLAALVVCAAGYGEGARLAASLPGFGVTAWSLVAALPVVVPGLVWALAAEPADPSGRAVAGVLWLALGSQILGLAVWYRGLARAGVARAGQLQLAQPLLTLVWSVTLLAETLPPHAPAAAVAVLVCVLITQRTRG
jgi:drug/metabolite transporter (DMT)-like permease